jgi:hypothetical protein
MAISRDNIVEIREDLSELPIICLIAGVKHNQNFSYALIR